MYGLTVAEGELARATAELRFAGHPTVGTGCALVHGGHVGPGDDHHPAWFLNLRDDPDVEVAFAGKPKQRMRARVATPEERAALWTRVTDAYKGYAGYQTKTDREIPLVLLEEYR